MKGLLGSSLGRAAELRTSLGSERFDCIVVGAGPAGVSASVVMARAGLRVLLLERGEYPGAKNMFGGVIYRWPLEALVPRFWESAPVERTVTEYRYMLLSENSGLTISYRNLGWANSPHNSFTALRARFDRWYASIAEQAGVVLANSVTVTDVIKDGDAVVGVRSNGGSENEAYADVVIGADGVKSEVGLKAGLRPLPTPKMVALGIKEVFEMPSDVIDSRFNLKRGEGTAVLVLGVTHGKMGGGFVYTNKDSLSVGLVISLDHLMKLKMKPWELLDEFENHPLVAPLLDGGKRKEYSAHMIPEAGYKAIPQLISDGIMLIGDAAFLCDVQYFECTNLAMASGMLAAETVVRAKKENDFSAKSLGRYGDALKESYVIRELRKRRSVPDFLLQNPRLFREYPTLVNRAIGSILSVDGVSKDVKRREIIQDIRKRVGLIRLLQDLLQARKLLP